MATSTASSTPSAKSELGRKLYIRIIPLLKGVTIKFGGIKTDLDANGGRVDRIISRWLIYALPWLFEPPVHQELRTDLQTIQKWWNTHGAIGPKFEKHKNHGEWHWITFQADYTDPQDVNRVVTFLKKNIPIFESRLDDFFASSPDVDFWPLDQIKEYVRDKLENLEIPRAENIKAISPAFNLFWKKDGVVHNDNTSDMASVLAVVRSFAGSTNVIVIVHGFRNRIDAPWMHKIKNAILRHEKHVVVMIVGWGKGANSNPNWEWSNFNPFNILHVYVKAAANIQTVGKWLADQLKHIKNAKKDGNVSIRCIGHSLGAHIVGMAGRESQVVDRIDALDPAGPCFEDGKLSSIRLRSTDANFVQVIHTDGFHPVGEECDGDEPAAPGGDDDTNLVKNYGTMLPLGDVDFYPNWGCAQPHNTTNPTGIFSHSVAYTLFRDSVRRPGRYSTTKVISECPRIRNRINDKCIKTGKEVQMGYHCSTEARGCYYLLVLDCEIAAAAATDGVTRTIPTAPPLYTWQDPPHSLEENYLPSQDGFMLVVMFNNYTFRNPNLNRLGAEHDTPRLCQLFEKDLKGSRQYKVLQHENVSLEEFESMLKEVLYSVERMRQKVDGLILVVMSHGSEWDELQLVDGHLVSTCEIIKEVTACPGLAGKPKIFIRQLCRGEKHDLGIPNVDAVPIFPNKNPNRKKQTTKLPTTSDSIIINSTIAGHVSYRYGNGTWFIQTLCRIIDKNQEEELSRILLKAGEAAKCADHGRTFSDGTVEERKQLCNYENHGFKRFYF